MAKELLAMDIECYRNYFLVMFRNVITGNTRPFEMFDGQALDVETIKKIMAYYTIITFNGNNYDLPLLCLALTGASNDDLKNASDAIIVGGLKYWEFEKRFNVWRPTQWDHIDVFEVPPGRVSLKIYGGRLHAKRMQDLPIDPSASILPEQRSIISKYCGNDLLTTVELFNYLRPQITLREKMSKLYGQDLRSKSDAQIAEAVIVTQAKKLLNADIFRPPCDPGSTFKYHAPEFLKFNSQVMQDTLQLVKDTTFVISKDGNVIIPDSLAKKAIVIRDGSYRMGIGGLHSSESCVTHLVDDETKIVDFDVTSYYPAIILNNNLYPKHIGTRFLTIYKNLVDRRLAAKRAGDKVTADALKITINGSFGKFGSKWSKLYSPDLLIQTTVTGQLALLMLIERFEEKGIRVLSANTDGIVTKFHCLDEKYAEDIVRQWSKETEFEIESNEYCALYSRDVNNYIAVKPDGHTKTKGAFAEEGLQKNPTNAICVDAVVKFLIEGVPFKDTICNCRDITKFVTIRQVKGGGVKGDQYLGKAVRWYYAKNVTGTITYKDNGNTVARSEGAKPLMDLPEEFPDDINYEWYIEEARFILQAIGFYKQFI